MTVTTSGIARHKSGTRMDDEASLRHWHAPAILASSTPAPHQKLSSVETGGYGYVRRLRGEVKSQTCRSPIGTGHLRKSAPKPYG
jgi:hypothetical protein